MAVRRRVDDEHAALGAAREQRLGASASVRSKLQSQGVIGTPAPRPKNSTPSISAASPWSTVAALQPAAASRSASSVSLLPGTSTVGALDRGQRLDRLREALVDRGEVARPDDDVGAGAELDQPSGLIEVAVQVAEGEDPHRRQPTPCRALPSSLPPRTRARASLKCIAS